MPGGGKGPSSSGNITQTTQNPTQQAQLPFLTGEAAGTAGFGDNPRPAGFNAALDLNQHDPLQYYPGQTLADFNPAIGGGFQGQINQYGTGLGIAGQANSLFGSATGGGMSGINSPAFNPLTAIGGQTGGSTATLNALGQREIDAGSEYSNEFGSLLNQGTGVGNQVDALGNLSGEATAAGRQYSNGLSTLAYNGSGATPYAGTAAGYGAQAAANPYAGELAGMAGGPINGLGAGYGLLGHAGATAAQPNLATRTLGAEASGAFLGKNPYIDAEFGAAARPVVNAYQTATAPQADSTAEASGRYGSGFVQNNRDINQQDLGKTLGDMGANLYGQDYANERGLMTSAQGTLGSLINQGNQLEQSAGSALGSLGLGEFGARTGALNQAGNQYLTGLGEGITGAGAAANILQNERGQTGQLLNQAGSQYQAGIANAGNLENSAGNLRLGDFSSRLQAVQDRENAYNNGLSLARQAYGQAGGLANSALSTLQSGYDTGNRNSLIGLGMEPQVMSQNYAPAQQMTAGGQGLTGLAQQQINDQQNRFYGNIQAPWQTASQYMNLIGNPQTGSSSTTTPVLGPNAASSALGTLGSLGSLGNNLGLFGGGGGAGLIGGGGLGFDASLPSFASFGTPTAAELASATLAPEFGAGAAASAGGSILADFLPFLGF